MTARRILVAALTDDDPDPTLAVSHARRLTGEEVVHLGSGLDAEGVARSAVAEDAVHVVVVGTEAEAGAVRDALTALEADDVTVSTQS